ncbi:MAG TPA: hypothetical protein DD738_05930 [Ruminiclostridium sp.]|nr:hypothetical protein [Ruminiclostridium sp.]
MNYDRDSLYYDNAKENSGVGFMRKAILLRLSLMVLTLLFLFLQAGCNRSVQNRNEPSSVNKKANGSAGYYDRLVINDFPLSEGQYLVERIEDSVYILLDSEIITSCLKLPYATSLYPELSIRNGQITLYWTHQDQIVLRADMVENSHEAYINGSNEPLDIAVGPKTADGRLFIPINLFLSVLKMEETYDKSLNITFLHYAEDFPADLIQGKWSDSNTDLFTIFKDAPSGLKGLSSFASAYQFNPDGTYRCILISAGSFKDSAVQRKGKYRILGNTIIYYDTHETLYEGSPLSLSHKDKKLSKPSYDFIGSYDPGEDQIKIGAFWHHRISR